MGSITDWISAISAVLALGFAIWARYMAESSKKAQAEAAKAEQQAKQHLEAVTRQAASLERIAQTLARPDLAAEWVNVNTVFIRNNGSSLVELHGSQSEQILDFEAVTLEPGRSVRLYVFTAMGLSMPGDLTFETATGTVTVRLDLASRPA